VTVAQGVATDEVAGGGLTLTGGVLVASAPIAIPASASLTNTALQFEGDPNTGLAWLSADTIAIVAGGTSRLSMGAFNQLQGTWLINGVLGMDAGTSLSNCPIQKNGDANTGLSSPGGADTISIVAGGVEAVRVSATAISMTTIVANFGTTSFGSSTNTFQGGANLTLATSTGTKIGTATNQLLGFWNAAPVVQQTVTGSRAGNAALASLLTALATAGLVVDSSTA
jgi:hypothetical protein